MEEKHKKEEHELPHRELENSLAPSGSYIVHPRSEGHGHSPTHHRVSQQKIMVLPSQSNSPIPGIQTPGISIDTYNPGLSVTIKPLSNEVEEFHDSESGDIYDLYNAVNGETREDGFLDISKLDQLSDDEREILNVNRLRDIWRHMISGCATCAGIVRTLNSIRPIIGEEEFE
jgi:hypothetical protein